MSEESRGSLLSDAMEEKLFKGTGVCGGLADYLGGEREPESILSG